MLKGLPIIPGCGCRSPLLLRTVSPSPSLLICKNSTMSETSTPISKPALPNFVSLQHPHHSQPIHNLTNIGQSFRLVSYNILAQAYVKSSYFPHSPSSSLKWKARSQAVLTHLNNFEADFLCIQELDEFNSFYKKNMESVGYKSIYVQRTGGKRDGCGIFYKQSCAKLLLSEEIHYNDLVNQLHQSNQNDVTENKSNGEIDISQLEISPKDDSTKKKGSKGDPNDPRVRLKRDCVGLMSAFKLNHHSSNQLIIIANTHIYWDPEWADVKLAQVKYLLLRLSKFRDLISTKFNTRPPLIIAGDFNSTPGDQVYKYIISEGCEEEEAPIKLYSLYGSNGGEPKFTNYTPGFTGTLDYIFVSENNKKILTPVSLLQVPGPTSDEINGGLPNFRYPSDHLPVGADFEWSSYN